MKTLDEFNKERLEEWRAMDRRRIPHKNNIACPECGEELWDSDPMVTLTSNPAKKNIHCEMCGFRGYRIA